MERSTITVCFLPGREASYVRSRVLFKGMQEAGMTVHNCAGVKRNNWRYVTAFWNFLRLKGRCDIIVVGFLGQFLMPLVKLFTRKKIIFDTFVSVYQTLAFDRKKIKPAGFMAALVRSVEKCSCRIADRALLDTQQQIDYFIREYALDRSKFERSWLGADDSFSHLRSKRPSEFLVHFHGEFQALHGTKYILQAAQLLPHVKFRMVGGGAELDDCMALAGELKLSNVTFIPFAPHDKIPEYVADCSICLGIFGETYKTQIVIPFKIYEGLAMGRAVISADTPAVRELLTHGENIYLCKSADPRSLADAIEALRTDTELRERIAGSGYELYRRVCSPKAIGLQIRQIAEDLLKEP